MTADCDAMLRDRRSKDAATTRKTRERAGPGVVNRGKAELVDLDSQRTCIIQIGEFMDISSWTVEDLEQVECCPVCRSEQSTRLHAELADLLFESGRGRWTLFTCGRCGSAYLNPRPRRGSIGRAYASYYTHVDTPPSRLTKTERVRRRFQYGYLNLRYGYNLAPASRLGALAVLAIPKERSRADRHVRYLAKPKETPRILDVGCGNGAFLELMQWAGWDVRGMDRDAEAVAVAKSRGVAAHVGTDEDLDALDAQSFDAVTIHHVLEHSYEPVSALRHAHRLLRPGGLLWVATPNLEAIGHRRFGPDWRGLEPPRHLTLFTPDTLRSTLRQAGFTIIGRSRGGWQAGWYFEQSSAIASNSQAPVPSPARLRMEALIADLVAWALPDRSEEISFVARRPPDDTP